MKLPGLARRWRTAVDLRPRAPGVPGVGVDLLQSQSCAQIQQRPAAVSAGREEEVASRLILIRRNRAVHERAEVGAVRVAPSVDQDGDDAGGGVVSDRGGDAGKGEMPGPRAAVSLRSTITATSDGEAARPDGRSEADPCWHRVQWSRSGSAGNRVSKPANRVEAGSWMPPGR